MTLLGYVQIITRGSIYITGDVTATVSPEPDKQASESDWDAWRQENLDASGNTTIGMYSNIDITVSGGVTVVPGFITVVPEGIRLIAWAEW